MSDLMFLYCGVTYLFNLGLVFASWGECNASEEIGSVVCLILSPLSLPIIFGVGYWKRHG